MHASILAVVLWVIAAVLIVAVPGPRDVFGTLKAPDFLHFYTIGRVALLGDRSRLYDSVRQHELQVELVPASAPDAFIPIYPPQAALVFAPLAWLSFPHAAIAWALVTIAVYAFVVYVASACVRRDGHGGLIAAAAAGFPPFWNLVLHGQSTTIPLFAFAAAWMLLERRREFRAGLALGLIAIKPQLGLVVAVVVLASRNLPLLAGIVLSVAVQLLLSMAVFGPGVIADYVGVLQRMPELTTLLEPKPYQLHSIRAVTNLLPSWLGLSLWLVTGAVVTGYTVRLWRGSQPLAIRIGALVLATVLVCPHLTIYDATLLALPLLLFACPALGGSVASRLGSSYYLLYLTLLVPTAALIGIQLSVFVMIWIFWTVARD